MVRFIDAWTKASVELGGPHTRRLIDPTAASSALLLTIIRVLNRILDIDLDLFVHGTAYWCESRGERLDPEDYPPWSLDAALEFLTNRCGLDGPLPGFAVEHHGELFARWRTAIEARLLVPPFHVTHADAHADLGLGDAGYMYLMSELLYKPPAERRHPDGGTLGADYSVGDGNYLAFAAACRWISDLVYVFNDGGDDVLAYVMEDFNLDGSNLQLRGVPRENLKDNLLTPQAMRPEVIEPLIPFRKTRWTEYHVGDQPFDFICLARSPGFTPAGCDQIFDEIRRRFVGDPTVD